MCESTRLGAKLKYPGGIFFSFRTTPGGNLPRGEGKKFSVHTYLSLHTHKRWTRSTNKRSERRGREGRIKGTPMGQPRPSWCWILRHQEEGMRNMGTILALVEFCLGGEGWLVVGIAGRSGLRVGCVDVVFHGSCLRSTGGRLVLF